MRALILAAGEGRRLEALTRELPKPMLAIAGRPILEHNVRLLVRHGVREIAINTHHRSEKIVEHFGDGSAFGAEIRYSHEPSLRGTAGALLPLADFFNETFTIVFGDNLSTCDLSRLAAAHRSGGALATVALYFREDSAASGLADLADDGSIKRFVEKPSSGVIFSNWVNAGIIVAEPALLRYIPRDRPSDLGKDVLPALISDRKTVRGYRMNEQLWWVDTPSDYARTSSCASL